MIKLGRVAVIVVMALASGCTSAAQSDGPTTDPSPATSTARPEESAVSEIAEISGARADHPVHGSWTSTVTTANATAALKKWHLDEWAEQFIDQEGIGDALPQVVTFHGDTFSIAYHEGDIWHVGWHGPLRIDDEQLSLTDAETGTTDTFAWRIDGDQLTLTPLRTDATGLLKGLPELVYDVGYFESIPLTRTACDPTEMDC